VGAAGEGTGPNPSRRDFRGPLAGLGGLRSVPIAFFSPRPTPLGCLLRSGEAVRAARLSGLNARRVGTAVSAVIVAGLAIASAFTTGHTNSPTRTDFVTGTAWVASFAPGQVSLLDGSTGAIVDQLSGSRLPGVLPGDQIEVAQAGSGAYVADSSTGVLDRIDGATHDVVSVPMWCRRTQRR
jgi:hypothetical protein